MDPPDLLGRRGLMLVLGFVLGEQAGLPLPAAPILVAAGAFADAGTMAPEYVLAAALAACLLADHAWFFAGRRLLARICTLSLSPDTCVSRTDDLISQHGARVLLAAKFIPGISAVAIPTAAAMGRSYRRFVVFDALGCLLWSGAYVGAGMIFSREIATVLAAMSTIGVWSLVAIGGLLALYIGFKERQRARLQRLFHVVRITAEEMRELMATDSGLLVLDARSELLRKQDPRRLPRSIVVGNGDALRALPSDGPSRTVVTFCTCPNEASAAFLADRLIRAGYGRVRDLVGGAAALTALEG
jgi:membrane protein DedA with SNARE-associated domain/rhodanese-related sulfurtransferase